ncbi:hypothetical protein [Ekhidna sp.]|jgi:hypothetical protein|uniref:hypothetical protein n=1 Tax=Ekhidna sp. TaxID=2608089 RepID=UPI0032EB1143
MKALVAYILIILSSFTVFSQKSVYVKGYFRSNGTYVAPHYRSAPDGNFYNNWSTYGNINPYTGKEGTKVTPPKYRSYSSNIDNFNLAPLPEPVRGATYSYNYSNNALPTIQLNQVDYKSIPDNIKTAIAKKASRTWDNDFEMQAYVRKTQSEGYLKLIGLINQSEKIGLETDVIEWSMNIALSKWPDDYSMQAYIFENSVEGYLKLSAIISSDEWKSLPASVSTSILDRAYSDWQDDLSMQAYIVEKQLNGFYELVQLEKDLKELPINIQSQIRKKAIREWPRDLDMQAYIIEREINGYKSLNEY